VSGTRPGAHRRPSSRCHGNLMSLFSRNPHASRSPRRTPPRCRRRHHQRPRHRPRARATTLPRRRQTARSALPAKPGYGRPWTTDGRWPATENLQLSEKVVKVPLQFAGRFREIKYNWSTTPRDERKRYSERRKPRKPHDARQLLPRSQRSLCFYRAVLLTSQEKYSSHSSYSRVYPPPHRRGFFLKRLQVLEKVRFLRFGVSAFKLRLFV
jgi:hypothetical protein